MSKWSKDFVLKYCTLVNIVGYIPVLHWEDAFLWPLGLLHAYFNRLQLLVRCLFSK